MATKKKITKEMILEAAYEMVRRDGHERLSVRNLAQELGCSTQPILYQFKTVNELRAELYRMADEYHNRYIMPPADAPEPILALGLNYIRFGSQEKNLFRFLFQSNPIDGQAPRALFGTNTVAPILSVVSASLGCSRSEARALFAVFFVTAHGCASLIANNAMEYSEAAFEIILRKMLDGLTAQREKKQDGKDQ